MSDRPLPWAPRSLAALASRVYLYELSRRNRAFDAGKGVEHLDRPVISIGNLSVGGTGKTPMVRWVVQRLQQAGRKPCIAMRGYRRAGQERSDEEAEYLRGLPGCPVVAQPDRAAGLRALFATSAGASVDVVVLDDGFQHRRLSRNLDIVLLDASRSPLNDRPLPAGWLREPMANLARADAVVITHAELAPRHVLDALAQAVERVLGRSPVAVTSHAWSVLRTHDDNELPLEWLAQRTVLAVCGIGNPTGFLHAARAAAGNVESAVFPDHAPYPARRAARIASTARAMHAEAIVTTDKDWSKLRAYPQHFWPCPVVRAGLELRFVSGESALRELVYAAAGETTGQGQVPSHRSLP
ncbi:MAG: tetraacyldisaccharide 4'-kinase [Phycisphaeraceae bacterium]|nr:tetraacyldisaccharide 4'-kinase [Phycisphaeraceae bacterium]MCW5754969.1 tetraacyldisaccharide 4'-kinase [Phycisphaeraceae bacterium]